MKLCTICRSTDHFTWVCPKRCAFCVDQYMVPELHDINKHRCYICNLVGAGSHATKNCPEKCTICAFWHNISEHRCYICNSIGMKSHKDENCPYKFGEVPPQEEMKPTH